MKLVLFSKIDERIRMGNVMVFVYIHVHNLLDTYDDVTVLYISVVPVKIGCSK